METYEVTCTCGDVMKTEATNEEEAIETLKEQMNEAAVRDHWREMHKGEPVPSVMEVHRMIEDELILSAPIL
jgi:hypothetical protein